MANIAANLIAFLAVLEFINAALRWLGEMVDIKGLSFQVPQGQPRGLGCQILLSPPIPDLARVGCRAPCWVFGGCWQQVPELGVVRRICPELLPLGCRSQVICSYILMPVAFLMGADWADSPVVAELLGIKIFLNEFVAYQQLATYKKNRLSGLEEWDGSRKQWISVRGTCHPARDRAGMEPAETGHGTGTGWWVWAGRGMVVLGLGGHLWLTTLGWSRTAGYGATLKESVKPL